MNKYFEVKPGSALYEDYFAYLGNRKEVMAAFDKVCEEFGIETKSFYLTNRTFRIVPTDADREKFSGMMKKTSDGEFKKMSAPYKMWISLTKDIAPFTKPQLFYYMKDLIGRWRERLFDFDGKLYCSIESESEEEMETPEWADEMKASEFYKILEESEE